jgi:hypothetical protein
MKYSVDGWNNFCRVFELPQRFSSKFCFGGIPTNFQMVDWFNPVPDIGTPAVSKEVWKEKVGDIETVEIDHDELSNDLIGSLRMKRYIRPDRTYLIICDFGASFIFK